MERIVERVLERQLPSIVARLAASGTATARTETSRSLPSKGGSKLSTFTQFLSLGMMSCDRALTYCCHAGGRTIWQLGQCALGRFGKRFREDRQIRQ